MSNKNRDYYIDEIQTLINLSLIDNFNLSCLRDDRIFTDLCNLIKLYDITPPVTNNKNNKKRDGKAIVLRLFISSISHNKNKNIFILRSPKPTIETYLFDLLFRINLITEVELVDIINIDLKYLTYLFYDEGILTPEFINDINSNVESTVIGDTIQNEILNDYIDSIITKFRLNDITFIGMNEIVINYNNNTFKFKSSYTNTKRIILLMFITYIYKM